MFVESDWHNAIVAPPSDQIFDSFFRKCSLLPDGGLPNDLLLEKAHFPALLLQIVQIAQYPLF